MLYIRWDFRRIANRSGDATRKLVTGSRQAVIGNDLCDLDIVLPQMRDQHLLDEIDAGANTVRQAPMG